jgi:hypothetical protein
MAPKYAPSQGNVKKKKERKRKKSTIKNLLQGVEYWVREGLGVVDPYFRDSEQVAMAAATTGEGFADRIYMTISIKYIKSGGDFDRRRKDFRGAGGKPAQARGRQLAGLKPETSLRGLPPAIQVAL